MKNIKQVKQLFLVKKNNKINILNLFGINCKNTLLGLLRNPNSCVN